MVKQNTIKLSLHCQSPAEKLWPYLADFNLLGHIFRAPSIEKHDDTDGYLCHHAGVDLTQSWFEAVPQWVQNCWWQRLRRDYKNSLFSMTCEEMQFDHSPDSTLLHYMLTYQAKSFWSDVLLRTVFLPLQLRRIKACLKNVDRCLSEGKLPYEVAESLDQSSTLESCCGKLEESPYTTMSIHELCQGAGVSYHLAEATLSDMYDAGGVNLALKAQCLYCSAPYGVYEQSSDVPDGWSCHVCGCRTSPFSQGALDTVVKSRRVKPVYAPLSPTECSQKALAHVTLNQKECVSVYPVPLKDTAFIRVYFQDSVLQQTVDIDSSQHGLHIQLSENRICIQKTDNIRTLCFENLEESFAKFLVT